MRRASPVPPPTDFPAANAAGEQHPHHMSVELPTAGRGTAGETAYKQDINDIKRSLYATELSFYDTASQETSMRKSNFQFYNYSPKRKVVSRVSGGPPVGLYEIGTRHLGSERMYSFRKGNPKHFIDDESQRDVQLPYKSCLGKA